MTCFHLCPPAALQNLPLKSSSEVAVLHGQQVRTFKRDPAMYAISFEQRREMVPIWSSDGSWRLSKQMSHPFSSDCCGHLIVWVFDDLLLPFQPPCWKCWSPSARLWLFGGPRLFHDTPNAVSFSRGEGSSLSIWFSVRDREGINRIF